MFILLHLILRLSIFAVFFIAPVSSNKNLIKNAMVTKELARFSDLYHLENLECLHARHFIAPRLYTCESFPPSLPVGVKYCLRLLCDGESPAELLNNVKSLSLGPDACWALEYDCLSPLSTERELNSRKSFTSKSLSFAIAQTIKCAPCLNPIDALISYYIIETKERLYFGEKEHLPNNNEFLQAEKLWSSRPFIFSAATNFEMSSAIINILGTRCEAKLKLKANQLIFYDPCCGTGTNLFVAYRYYSIKYLT